MRPPDQEREVCATAPSPCFWAQVAAGFVLAAAFTLGFFGIDHLILTHSRAGGWVWDPCLGCESRIPYAPGWIWVYLAYYPLCFAPLLLPSIRRDRGLFWRVAGAYLVQFGVGFLVFWFLPSQMVRPLPAGAGLTGVAMAWTYRLDPGFNIFPSLHVANLVCVSWLFRRLQGGTGSRLMWGATGLVALSTLLVKQHCLVDLAAGAGLGLAAGLLWVPSRVTRSHRPPH